MRRKLRNITLFGSIVLLIILISFFSLQSVDLVARASDNKDVWIDEKTDSDILKYYHEPSMKDAFEDNVVNVIFKDGVSGKICFDDFELYDSEEIITMVKYKEKTIVKDSKDELSIDEDENAIIRLTLSTKSKTNVLAIAKRIQEWDKVLVAEPQYIYEAVFDWIPSDAYYSEQWGLNGSYGINAESAWNLTTGNTAIKIGLFESGAQMGHPDLNGVVLSGNHTGFQNDEHGTHVAGIIGAIKNSYGVTGVADALIYLLDRSSFVDSLEHATSRGISVINASFHFIESSTSAYASYNATHYTAIRNFKGLLICSAGNDNIDIDANPMYPACYNLPNIITVGSINNTGAKSSFSNYGESSVDLFAPGEHILSTYPVTLCNAGTCNLSGHYANGYHYMSGTSMATPFVTGTVALMMSLYETIPNTMSLEEKAMEVRKGIINSVSKDYTNPLYGLCISDGYLNTYNALLEFGYKRQIFDNFGYIGTTYYWKGKVDMTVPHTYSSSMSGNTLLINDYETLNFKLSTESSKNAWSKISGSVNFQLKDSTGTVYQIEGQDTFTSTVNVTILNSVTLNNTDFSIDVGSLPDETYTLTLTSVLTRNGWTHNYTKTFTFIVDKPPLCVAEGSLITLADGNQVAVENLTGDENLLVWNMLTGQFDSAPILFIDSDPLYSYEVAELTFSDGTIVKVIYEHAFFDMTLGEYVFLKRDASQYIGHYFSKQEYDSNNNMVETSVQLTNVAVYMENTTTWSPVTYGHLCYYVNGMLSMPGATEGLINIFDVDTTLMKYDSAQMAADIQTYGLYTYAEFNAIIPLPEYVFNAFNGQYLKVSIGKGLITLNEIAELLERYSVFFD